MNIVFLQKNIQQFFLIILIIFISIIFFPSFINYEGSKLIYFIYSLSVNIFFVISLYRTFIILIFSLLTWLGFWFKISSAYAFNYYFGKFFQTPFLSEAVQHYKIDVDIITLDKIFFEFSILFLFMSIIIFFFSKKKNIPFTDNDWKLKNIKYYLFCFIFILSLLNYFFGIYQKGFEDQFFEIKFLSLGYRFFYYLVPNLMILMLLSSKYISYSEIKKNLFYFILLNFFLFSSMLSREYILFTFLMIIIFCVINFSKINYKYILFISTVFIILSVANIKFTEKIRWCKNDIVKKNILTISSNFNCLTKYNVENSIILDKEENIFENNFYKKNLNQIGYLAISRWVGLESVYIKKKNLDLINLVEGKNNFINSNFIPGLFYTIYHKNIFKFLFLSIILILFLNFLNNFLTKNSNNKYFFYFFCYVLIYRIFHSGLAFSNTFFFILLILILSFTLKKISNQNLKIFKKRFD